jgi:hypothetical protein
MYFTTPEGWEDARQLAEIQRNVTAKIVESSVAAGMTDLEAMRKAYAKFLDLAKAEMNLSSVLLRQTVGIYERFGQSEMRPELTRLFGLTDISALTSKSDEKVQLALTLKGADPQMTRHELMSRLATH